MTRVRRRLLRAAPAQVPLQSSQRTERWQRELAVDRDSSRRWMTRLKRAFRTVDRLQGRISRLERQLSQSR
jgi:hypothetical protein